MRGTSNFNRLLRILIAAIGMGICARGAPKLTSPVTVNSIQKTSAVISWTTDVPTAAQVILTTGPGDDYTPLRRVRGEGTLSQSHSITLTELQPATDYWFYTVSTDARGAVSRTVADYNAHADDVKFTTLAASLTGAIDYRLYAAGPKNVFSGSDLFFQLTPVLLSGPPDHLYFTGITGLPANITPHLLCRAYTLKASDADCFIQDGVQFAWQGNTVIGGQPITVRLRTAPGTPSGTYTVHLETRSGEGRQNVDYTFHVVALPEATSVAAASAPPIPGLANWESLMTKLGRTWCDPNEKYGFGYEGSVWYYDGGRVYFQIADYTQDPYWLVCANNIISQYRAEIFRRNGGIQGWRQFPQGMAMDYWRSGNLQDKEAIGLMQTGNQWVTLSGSPDPLYVRETAYAVNVMVQHEQLTGERDFHLAQAVDYLIGDIDLLSGSDPDGFQQAFFDGLLMESLIQYHELTGDPRIPPMVKRMLDWIWEHSWDRVTHKLQYNPLDVPGQYLSVMNNLVVPAYAWYWNLSKDPTYRAEGDEMFLHALDEDIDYSGKIFSQNYRWSFDYVRWRSGILHSATHRSANEPGGLPLIDALSVTADLRSATFRWHGSAASAWIRYESTNGDARVSEFFLLADQAEATVKLTGLQSATSYTYSLIVAGANGKTTTSTGRFKTAGSVHRR